MLRGHWRGETLGSGSDVWKYWAERRAGNLAKESWDEIEDGIARSPGTCMTMGTAATMMSLAEALGMSLPGASSIPAVDASHQRMCTLSGRRIVELVWEQCLPSEILIQQAYENAIMVDMAIGGSTNAIIHLTALAGRSEVVLNLETFDRVSSGIPLLLNLRPSGKYLMEDFYYAGGLRALLKQLEKSLHLDALTVNGRSLGENILNAKVYEQDVIRTIDKPVQESGGTAILRGSLAPDGAVIKPTAAEKRLWKHQGPAVVFKNYQDLKDRIDSDDLEVDENSVLVLQNAGPVGAPGMPEWGQLPIPKKMLERGIRAMVRISDARMSGTSYGACILHVAPESALGSPLALVQDGDLIELDVQARKLDLLVDESELEQRRSQWQPPESPYRRGFTRLYQEHVSQANLGCDFDFLLGKPGETREPDIF